MRLKLAAPLALSICLVACAPTLETACLSPQAGLAGVRQHLEAEAGNGFRGAVVANFGRNELQWSSPGYDVNRTRFWVASISKPITATAAVRMADQDRIDLGAKVGDLFPNVEGDVGEIALIDLLAHRSGLGGDYAADGIGDRDLAVSAIVERGREHSSFFYSNKGYSLAAAMLERLSGRDYGQVLRDEVFNPLGMTRSGVWGDAIEPGDFARTRNRLNPSFARDYGRMGSTGVYSTAGDMMRFLDGLATNRTYLSDGGSSLLWTPRWAPRTDGRPATGASYGLGWGLDVVEGAVVRARHGGYDTGLHNGQLVYDPGRAFRLVVLADDVVSDDLTWSQRIADGVDLCLAGQTAS